jgi:serine/threonine protein kinase
VLGQGGMGIVHEAIARGAHDFSRRVVIKQLRSEATLDPTLVKMFLDEARIASRLHHAGIISILDYGIFDGLPFQVLELVDGVDVGAVLRQLVARGERMPVDLALFIATEVAHALAYAHDMTDERGISLGIVHRDVKPSNVLLSWGGDVKLGDFGIAKARLRSFHTMDDVQRGTPPYMAPEQIVGAAVDERTDLFALGATLHAMICGRSPLTSAAAQAALLRGEVTLSSELPPDVYAIVTRAMRRPPSERFPNARAMAAALGEALVKHLRTDPRSRLIEWLEAFRAPAAPPTPSAAPARAAPTILTMTSTIDGERFFTTAEPSKRSLRPPSDATRREHASSRPERKIQPFVIAALVTLALGVGIGGVALAVRARSRPVPPTSPTVVDSSPVREASDAAPTNEAPLEDVVPEPSTRASRDASSHARASAPRHQVQKPKEPKERCVCRHQPGGDYHDLCVEMGTTNKCVCSSEDLYGRGVLCPTRREADGSCKTNPFAGNENDACEALDWKGNRASGHLRCWRCKRDEERAIPGEPCSGVIEGDPGSKVLTGSWYCPEH